GPELGVDPANAETELLGVGSSHAKVRATSSSPVIYLATAIPCSLFLLSSETLLSDLVYSSSYIAWDRFLRVSLRVLCHAWYSKSGSGRDEVIGRRRSTPWGRDGMVT
ncbi:unnamed protein product, partial [Urochloa humidicola]